jgi:hypothetical protein
MHIKVNLPTKEALLEAMNVAKNSKDAANYLATRFDEILVKAKVGPEADELRERVHVFAKHVAYQLDQNGGAWKGREAEESPFKNMHAHIADEATAFLGNLKQEGVQDFEIRLDYAINNDGQFVRSVETVDAQNELTAPGNDEARSYDVQA